MSIAPEGPRGGSRRMRVLALSRRVGVLFAVGAPWIESEAQAAPGALILHWSTAPGCPPEAAVRTRVETLLGGTAGSLARGTVTVTGEVTLTSAGAELRLDTEVPEGEGAGARAEPLHGTRTLRGASCDEVTAAGALVIALAIDPKAVDERSRRGPVAAFSSDAPADVPHGPAAETAPVPAMPAATSPPPAPHAHPAEPRSPPATTEGILEARLLGDVGSLPGPSLGAGLGAGFEVGRFLWRLEAAYLFPRFAAASTRADGRTEGANVSLVAFDLSGCYVALPGTLELDLCGSVEPGALLAVGTGFDRSTSAVAPWLAAGASAEVRARVVSALSIRAGAGALSPFGRSRIRFSELAGNSRSFFDLDRPSAVSGRAFVGVQLSF